MVPAGVEGMKGRKFHQRTIIFPHARFRRGIHTRTWKEEAKKASPEWIRRMQIGVSRSRRWETGRGEASSSEKVWTLGDEY